VTGELTAQNKKGPVETNPGILYYTLNVLRRVSRNTPLDRSGLTTDHEIIFVKGPFPVPVPVV
jgi:hypothetical protein